MVLIEHRFSGGSRWVRMICFVCAMGAWGCGNEPAKEEPASPEPLGSGSSGLRRTRRLLTAGFSLKQSGRRGAPSSFRHPRARPCGRNTGGTAPRAMSVSAIQRS